MLIVLSVLAVFLFVLTSRGIARLRRGYILSLVAGLIRQEVPVEAALTVICSRHSGSVLGLVGLRRLARRLENGASLSEGLEALRFVTASNACVLDHAQEHGVAARVLERLAIQSVRIEKRELRTAALLAYPFVIGLLLLAITQFVSTFVLPKLEEMFHEMGGATSVCVPDYAFAEVVTLVALGLLFLWGVFLVVVQLSKGPPVSWLPVVGTHIRLNEQAQLARHFSIVLESGSTLEAAVGVLDIGGGGGAFRNRLMRIGLDLESGVPAAEAFRSNGPWRSEFLWAVDAIAKGAAPGTTFDTVAQVLEEKAEARLNAISRLGTPVAVLLAGCTVGWFTCIIFQTLNALTLQLL